MGLRIDDQGDDAPFNASKHLNNNPCLLYIFKCTFVCIQTSQRDDTNVVAKIAHSLVKIRSISCACLALNTMQQQLHHLVWMQRNKHGLYYLK